MAPLSLPDLTSLKDLPALAVELGFDATWHELALDALDPALPPLPPAAIVGRKGGALLLGLIDAEAERLAARTAAALDRRGSVALVAGLDPIRRRLTLSATVSDRPFATLDLDRLRAIDLRILERGRLVPSDRANLVSLGWAEALSGRSLDRRFFTEFRAALDHAIDALPARIPRRDRHALALLDLTRVLFLYFVQDRGWLDGRPRFLSEELALAARAGQIERRLFRPLFFGTLNTPVARRSVTARRFGRVPFLNGGLFEPRPLERRYPDDIPDEVWRTAFARVFERYHFTIAAEPGSGAIGPDMLGRVFEGVMDPDGRRETGAFYTPRALVDRVVRQALEAWLAEPGRGEGAVDLARPDATTLALVRGVAMLDPAVGSGAFLVGALRELVAIRVRGGESPGAATRAVVAHNLFGVDVNPSAVHLTELRLWLEVIQADPDTTPDTVLPLPNLDALIRQGDSVFEPMALPPGPGHGALIGAQRRRVVAASGPAKRRELKALRVAETKAARSAIAEATRINQHRIGELLAAARAPGLFGARTTPTAAWRRELALLRARRRDLRRIERRLVDTGALPWFHFPTQFADILGAGGFDLVVTNPPWVRAESLSATERSALKARYRWFRSGPGSGPGFRPLPDLAVPFLERAVELTRPGGVVAGIFPAKLLTAQWGAAARDDLARTTTLHVAADLSATAHGFDATVYPLALIAARRPPDSAHRVRTSLDALASDVPQARWQAGPWSAATAPAGGHPSIGDQFRIRLGLKTGADRCFLDPDSTVEAALVRPALRGRDVAPFRHTAARTLLYPHDAAGAPLERLPSGAARWLTPHRAALARRADCRQGPWWAVFRTEVAAARHRVVWADLDRDLAATVLSPRDPAIPLNTCYWISAPDRASALALAAWLNSGPIRALARERATPALSGFCRFNAGMVAGLPLPAPARQDAELIEIATEALRSGRVDQARLDRRAAALLG